MRRRHVFSRTSIEDVEFLKAQHCILRRVPFLKRCNFVSSRKERNVLFLTFCSPAAKTEVSVRNAPIEACALVFVAGC